MLPEEEYFGDENDILVETFLYTEKATSLIYECRLFSNFVLVRPASPAFYLSIKKLSIDEFANEFEEFCGDQEYARQLIANMAPDFVIDV